VASISCAGERSRFPSRNDIACSAIALPRRDTRKARTAREI